MQNGTLDKQWREYAKHAWDIAPTLGKPHLYLLALLWKRATQRTSSVSYLHHACISPHFSIRRVAAAPLLVVYWFAFLAFFRLFNPAGVVFQLSTALSLEKFRHMSIVQSSVSQSIVVHWVCPSLWSQCALAAHCFFSHLKQCFRFYTAFASLPLQNFVSRSLAHAGLCLLFMEMLCMFIVDYWKTKSQEVSINF